MATDYYSGHESVYRSRRAQGAPGWFLPNHDLGMKLAAVVEAALSSGQLPTTGKLLELGCGAGNLSVWLADKGYAVSGVDISTTAIDWAKQRSAEHRASIDFRVGNVVDLSCYGSEEFDIALDSYCLHCILGHDRQSCFSSINRVLRPMGWLLVFTGASNQRTEAIAGYDHQTHVLTSKDTPAPRYFAPPESILQEIALSGFRICSSTLVQTERETDLLYVQAQKPDLFRRGIANR